MGKKYMYGYGKELKWDYVPFFVSFFFLVCSYYAFSHSKKSVKFSYIYQKKSF